MSRQQEDASIVKVYNWAFQLYRAARNGGDIASLDLAVLYERALEIDHAMAAIADAARRIMRELHQNLPSADMPRTEGRTMTAKHKRAVAALKAWEDRLAGAIHEPAHEGLTAFQLVHQLDVSTDRSAILAWMDVLFRARSEIKAVLRNIDWCDRAAAASRHGSTSATQAGPRPQGERHYDDGHAR